VPEGEYPVAPTDLCPPPSQTMPAAAATTATPARPPRRRSRRPVNIHVRLSPACRVRTSRRSARRARERWMAVGRAASSRVPRTASFTALRTGPDEGVPMSAALGIWVVAGAVRLAVGREAWNPDVHGGSRSGHEVTVHRLPADGGPPRRRCRRHGSRCSDPPHPRRSGCEGAGSGSVGLGSVSVGLGSVWVGLGSVWVGLGWVWVGLAVPPVPEVPVDVLPVVVRPS
jgi:hypothetical protein